MTALVAPVDRPHSDAPPAARGLTSAQADAALARVGPNVLAEGPGPRWALRFARNFTHLFALLLWAGAALAVVGGQPPLAIAIVAVIVVNAIFSSRRSTGLSGRSTRCVRCCPSASGCAATGIRAS